MMAGLDWKWWVRDPVSDVYADMDSERITFTEGICKLLSREEAFARDLIEGSRPDGCRIESTRMFVSGFHITILEDIAKAERRRTGNSQPVNAGAFVAGIVLPVFFHTQRKRIKRMLEAKNGNK